MPSTPPPTPNSGPDGTRIFGFTPPVWGIVLTLLHLVAISAGDVISKYFSYQLPVLMVIWSRYLVHVLVVFAAIRPSRWPTAFESGRLALQLWRAVAMLLNTVAFILAIHFLPFADVIAIAFISPFIVIILARLFLGEAMNAGRWLACLAGFGASLFVIKPGFGEVELAILALPVLAAGIFAVVAVQTRSLALVDRSVTTMLWTGIVGLIATSIALPFDWVTPTPLQWLGLFVGGFLATGSQFLFIKANAYQKASVLAPFSYTELIWAVALGYAVFGDFPDAWTWLGMAIITACGLYVLRRETRKPATA
ncbi:MAG: DMT family transporter [Proteobacteria bacterium]|nr:DMT family transporter [Pseudomonadota bacterium]